MPATPNGPEDNQTISHPQGKQACTYGDTRSAPEATTGMCQQSILARGD